MHDQMGSFVCVICGFDFGVVLLMVFVLVFCFFLLVAIHTLPPFLTISSGLGDDGNRVTFAGQRPTE